MVPHVQVRNSNYYILAPCSRWFAVSILALLKIMLLRGIVEKYDIFELADANYCIKTNVSEKRTACLGSRGYSVFKLKT